jgi:TolB protein
VIRNLYFKHLCVIVIVLLAYTGSADTKIYIDITSPALRRLPVTINLKGPSRAREIEWIVKADLEATGLFEFVDPDIPGAELIADIDADISGELKVILSIKDLIENKEVLKKRLSSSLKGIRPVSHSIANDIYRVATGKKGVFRTKITFLTSGRGGRKDIRIMDWDGFNARRIVSRGLTSSHSWSADARYLLYSSERNRKWKIYILDRKMKKESILFSSRGLNIVGGTSVKGILAFSSSHEGSSEIYTIDYSGKNLRRLTRSYAIDVSPVFSPDGRRIAFVSDRGGTPQIYVMEADGGSPRRITFQGSYNTAPSWSPDGDHIAYTARINGKNQIVVVKFDGTDMRQLTSEGNNESPSYSPDGLFIAFDSDRNGKREIFIMRANGEGQKRISPSYLNAMSPRWSPYLGP